MQYIVTYVTCANMDEAKKIAEAAVSQRKAACANILDGMQSLYWWRGKLERASEAVVLFKTEEPLFEELKALILSLHSYETPCIVCLPITGGSQPYLDWIRESVSSSSK